MKLRHQRFTAVLTALILAGAFSAAGERPAVLEQSLWKSGHGGLYKGYRIPSLIVSAKGTLLAFIEGRNEGHDSGDIGTVLRRSTDNGRTWGPEIVVWDDGLNTCGNPCPVVDEASGRIWLFMTWNHGQDREPAIIRGVSRFRRLPFLCYSDDDGMTWSKPVDLSETCREASWGWYATGPGIGIQLKKGKYRGRLVIPADHSYDDPEGKIAGGPFGFGSHALISDDRGKTWRMSRPIRPGCNECQVAELPDGKLVMNMRSYNGTFCRAVSYSGDGGETWSPIEHAYQLVESICQAGLLDYGEYRGRRLYLFSNPAVPVRRTHLTVRFSADGCRTWYAAKLIWPGQSSYSCLARLPDGRIGLLFETWENDDPETIRFMSIDPGALFGADDIHRPPLD